jgi:DNA-binding HxlR family transcriptional regulator
MNGLHQIMRTSTFDPANQPRIDILRDRDGVEQRSVSPSRREVTQMSTVDLSHHYRYYELFRGKGDSIVLVCLAIHGPLRFGQLAQSVNRCVNKHIADSDLTRSLSRLKRDGLIDKVNGDDVVVYTLTPEGGRRAAQLRWVPAIPDDLSVPPSQRAGDDP